MEHKATLEIEGIKYKVLECEYEFAQAVKANGQPAGRPVGGLIQFIIVAPCDNDMRFHKWMMDKTTHHDGKITFEVQENNKLSPKTLSFKNAYCIRLYEYFNEYNNRQMYTKITISAEKITFGTGTEVTFQNFDTQEQS
jgi:hypothetical protein